MTAAEITYLIIAPPLTIFGYWALVVRSTRSAK